MSQQVSRRRAAMLTAWIYYGGIGGAICAGVVAWLVWHSVLAVLMAILLMGFVGFVVGILVMVVSMMRTKYPLRPPRDDRK